jgi:GxxExxY protein
MSADTKPDLDTLTRETIAAAIEVHRTLGPGFLEAMYEEALCIELASRGLPYARQVPIEVFYKSRPLGEFRLDLVIAGQLIVELKAVPDMLPIYPAQLLAYLRASDRRLGLVINFDVRVLRAGVRRVVNSL